MVGKLLMILCKHHLLLLFLPNVLTRLFCDSMEHKKLSPKCAFLKIKDPYAITVGDSLDLERTAIRNYIVCY